MDLLALLLLLVGVALGVLLGVLWSRGRWTGEVAALRARISITEQNRRELMDEIEERQSLEVLVAPLRTTLDKVEGRLREIEQARAAGSAALAQQIESVRASGEALRRETSALVTALRKPQVRGRWGEMHLTRAVELAGLVDRCDFHTQGTLPGSDGSIRPDLIVNLAGGKHVVVDAKVPLEAFLDAAEAVDEARQAERLKAHARQLRTHIDTLAGKAYWQRVPSTPEFVVMFVPGEAFLAAALDADPSLLEHAAARKVVVATPTTLIALLRTVAYAWTQESLASSAREVFDLGRELYSRLSGLGEHVDRLGRSLTTAVTAYNRTVGTLESRVLVSARRLRDLGVVDDEQNAPRPVE
jgi:DNA recombination protein RmuC